MKCSTEQAAKFLPLLLRCTTSMAQSRDPVGAEVETTPFTQDN
jgi:hypothetical protein